MIRIAIPVTDGQVTNHLGKCEKFLIADVEDGKILQQIDAPNPGHGPSGPPPVFLAKCRVNQIVAWGMPAHAVNMFDHLGIKTQLGATGDAQQVLEGYLNGTLTYTTEGLDGGGSCQ